MALASKWELSEYQRDGLITSTKQVLIAPPYLLKFYGDLNDYRDNFVPRRFGGWILGA